MESIVRVLDKEVPKLAKTFLEFPWENEECYSHYLAQSFFYVTHSVKLLKYAAEKTQNQDLKSCLLHHIEEEVGHELLAKNDLQRLGYNLNDFSEDPLTERIYQRIYEGIDRHGPAPIVGYAMALEGISALSCPGIARKLEARYGKQKSTFISLHAMVDQEHAKEGIEILKHFSDDELKVIEHYMRDSISIYTEFLNHLSARSRTYQVSVNS